MKKIALFILLTLSIGCKTNWISKTERILKKSENTFKLVKTFSSNKKEVSTKIDVFESDNSISKLKVAIKYNKIWGSNTKYYKNDTLIFAVTVNSLFPILYKRKRKLDEPIFILMEERIYFKNEKSGIKKNRKLLVYDLDDIKKLTLELSKKEFVIKDIEKEKYLNIKKMSDKYDKLLN